jgi:AcrR family transcriptional regulator
MLDVQAQAADTSGEDAGVARNLNGQKLGRKGRFTRQRILDAAFELIGDPTAEPISMSSVARRADLGMTSLYLYFTDLTELLLALLEPVLAEGRTELSALINVRWSDETLAESCDKFLRAFYGFWSRYSQLLHLRNSMADSGDIRMTKARVTSSQPMIRYFAWQMDGDPVDTASPAWGMATVLATGMERTVTVATDTRLTGLFGPGHSHDADHYLRPTARLMELAIRDTRAQAMRGEGR